MGFFKVKRYERYILWLTLGLLLTVFSCRQLVSSPILEPVPVVDATFLNQPLRSLGQPGPWAEISHLISYGNRLWFANSMFFNNHNSADIYSYAPDTGDIHWEQHLFSQSTGDPIVAKNLLYWPFEDPRFSSDLGEYMVTNGEQWQWHILPEGEAFHVHGMASHDGDLWAATGAWSGGVQRSSDGGKTWELVYTHPTPARRVSRVTHLVSLGDQLFAEVMAVHEQGSKVLHWQGADVGFQSVTGWPNGKQVRALTAFQDHVYGVNQNPDDSYSVWRTDGDRTEPIPSLKGYHIRAFAATETTLWAVSSTPGQGYLWRSENGIDWTAVQHFPSMRPLDVAVHNDHVYVGGRAAGKGVLWGPAIGQSSSQQISLTNPPSHPMALPQPTLNSLETQQQLSELKTILTRPGTYTDGDAQAILATTLLPIAMAHTPEVGQQLTDYLDLPLPVKSAQLFENNASAPARHVAQWYLLWAMGLNGYGQVPLQLLQEPWTEPENDREKYWHPAPAAAWTVAQLGQNDPATITAIIQRLTTQTDPLWLVGDFVGALHVLTGEQYGYDVSAWQQWWATSSDQPAP